MNIVWPWRDLAEVLIILTRHFVGLLFFFLLEVDFLFSVTNLLTGTPCRSTPRNRYFLQFYSILIAHIHLGILHKTHITTNRCLYLRRYIFISMKTDARNLVFGNVWESKVPRVFLSTRAIPLKRLRFSRWRNS